MSSCGRLTKSKQLNRLLFKIIYKILDFYFSTYMVAAGKAKDRIGSADA